jgi:redox-sensing transcriptional repressor
VAAFDSDTGKMGQIVSGLEITDVVRMGSVLAGRRVLLGIITTPPEFAQRAADCLVECGVLGILNFAGARVFTSADVFVENVDFFNHLYALSFYISQKDRA